MSDLTPQNRWFSIPSLNIEDEILYLWNLLLLLSGIWFKDLLQSVEHLMAILFLLHLSVQKNYNIFIFVSGPFDFHVGAFNNFSKFKSFLQDSVEHQLTLFCPWAHSFKLSVYFCREHVKFVFQIALKTVLIRKLQLGEEYHFDLII